MSRLRRLGVLMLLLVGLAFAAFGVDDLRMDAPPPMHERYFARIPGGAAPQVESLVLYMFDGQGGLFLGSGLVLLVHAFGALALGGGALLLWDRAERESLGRTLEPRRSP